MEHAFLIDQRNKRKMVIGGLDKEMTLKMERKLDRAEKRQKYYHSSTGHASSLKDVVSDTEDSNDDGDEVDVPCKRWCEVGSGKNLTEIPTVARECDRYNVSNAAGAAIATATLIDYGLISPDDTTLIIDRCKLRRQRERLRTNLCEDAMQSLSERGPLALFFDGRKDRTLCDKVINSKGYLIEDHYVLIGEPNSQFIGHVTPKCSSSKAICSSIIDFFSENHIDIKDIHGVGVDGTNVNTGIHGGVIRLLEIHLNKPLQWLVCMLHLNELPLRHILHTVDGSTSGPTSFTGVIGKMLQTCHELEIVDFMRRENGLPHRLLDVENLDLSKDQLYLYKMCDAIASGSVADSLAKKEPGPLVHSRWLTAANRILRLYVSTQSPSNELILLTNYVLQVYAPLWFTIKMQPECYEGSKHLWKLIQLSRFLPHEIHSVVDSCIQRNAYFAHPENLVLAMLADENADIRKKACDLILASRNSNSTSLRKFQLPNINFSAQNYCEIVDWSQLSNADPPLLKICDFGEFGNSTWKEKIGKIPNHSQCVERHVQLVTQAAAAVCGAPRRDGYIRAKLMSRKAISRYASKQDWSFCS